MFIVERLIDNFVHGFGFGGLEFDDGNDLTLF